VILTGGNATFVPGCEWQKADVSVYGLGTGVWRHECSDATAPPGYSDVLVYHALQSHVDVCCCLEADVRERSRVHEGTGLVSRWMKLRDGCTRGGKAVDLEEDQ
jgi:hypothetical protein